MKPRVIVIVDESHRRALADFESQRAMLSEVSAAIQVRLRNESEHAAIVALAKRSGLDVILNADPPIASALGVAAVHLGRNSSVTVDAARSALGADIWISVPAHDDADVDRARRQGASAVLVSPIFVSPEKAAPRGVSALSLARERAESMLVYALGGVTLENVSECIRAGADGVAIVRAVVDHDSPSQALRDVDAAVHTVLATRQTGC